MQWFRNLDLNDPVDRLIWALFSLSPILILVIVLIFITVIW